MEITRFNDKLKHNKYFPEYFRKLKASVMTEKSEGNFGSI